MVNVWREMCGGERAAITGFMLASLVLVGSIIAQAGVGGRGPRRVAISVQPTPVSTTIVLSASTSSTVCSQASENFFSQGVACNNTYASVDLLWTDQDAHITGMTCSEPNDASCTAQYTFYKDSGSATSVTCTHSNPSTSCTISSQSVAVQQNINMVAIGIADAGSNCGSLQPTCTVTYTIP